MSMPGMAIDSGGLPDPRWRPWRHEGTAMAPQLLLMVKLLFVLLLLEGWPGKLEAPFLPFLVQMDALRGEWEAPVTILLRSLFLAAGGLVLANVSVRRASILLGIVVIFAVVGSRPLFRNHIFICGCLFLLSGLESRRDRPWLVHAQMAVLYFGAFLSKIADGDWRNGVFMHHWLLDARENPLYAAAVRALPGLGVAVALSWFAMALELAMAIGFLIRRTQPLAVWAGILFHGGLFVMLRGEHFGHFLEDIMIAYLAFLNWPEGRLRLHAAPAIGGGLRKIQSIIDWDRRILVTGREVSSEVNGESGDRGLALVLPEPRPVLAGDAALRGIFRYSAGFYWLLFAGYIVALRFIMPPFGFVVVVLAGGAVVLLLAPFPWSRWLGAARRQGVPPTGPVSD